MKSVQFMSKKVFLAVLSYSAFVTLLTTYHVTPWLSTASLKALVLTTTVVGFALVAWNEVAIVLSRHIPNAMRIGCTLGLALGLLANVFPQGALTTVIFAVLVYVMMTIFIAPTASLAIALADL